MNEFLKLSLQAAFIPTQLTLLKRNNGFFFWKRLHSPGQVWRRTSRRWTFWEVSDFERPGTSVRQNMRWGQRRFVRRAGEIRLSRTTNACANTIPIKPAALRLHRLKMNVDLCILCERSLSYPTHRRRRSRLNCAYTLATLREDPDIGMTSTQGRCFRALLERAQRQFTMPQKSKIVWTFSQIR